MMLVKKIPLIFGLIFLSLVLQAQESDLAASRFGLSIIGGFNASQIDGDGSGGFNKVGIAGGIRSDIFLTKKTEMGIAILFSQRGSRPDITKEPVSDFNFGLSYIQVPITYSFKDWYQEDEDYFRVRAFGGLSFGRLIGTNLDETAFDRTPELLQKNSLGLHIGAGYNFGPKLRLTFLYHRGIIPIYNVRNKDNPVTQKSLVDRTISFRFEYSL